MKTTLDSKAFAAACRLAPIKRHMSLPVLEHIRLAENAAGLNLQATDLDCWLDCDVPGTVQEPGATLLPFSAFKKLKCESLRLATSNGHCDILADADRQQVNTLPEVEFPPLPVIPADAQSLPIGPDFFAALKACLSAASTDASRYVLKGVLIETNGTEWACIATQGRSLHAVQIDQPEGKHKVILPSNAVAWLIKFKPAYGTFKWWSKTGFNGTETEQWFAVDLGAYRGIGRCLDGNYPNWRQVVPLDMKEKIQFEADELIAAIGRGARSCTEKSRSVKLNFSRHLLTISSSDSEKGNSSATVAINYRG